MGLETELSSGMCAFLQGPNLKSNFQWNADLTLRWNFHHWGYVCVKHCSKVIRDHFVYVPSQWETLLCNVVSHWLGAYTKWSLVIEIICISVKCAWNKPVKEEFMTISWATPMLMKHFSCWCPGPRLNIKTVLSTYGNFHVKDKTAVRTSYL